MRFEYYLNETALIIAIGEDNVEIVRLLLSVENINVNCYSITNN